MAKSIFLCFVCIWVLYISVRWIQIPAWRWIAGGFKGKPDFPHTRLAIRKSKDTKHYKEMSKTERVCMLLGSFCMLSGIVLFLVAVSWFLVLDITGESTVDSIALTLFWVGALIYFPGFFITYISTRKDTKRGDSVVSE